MCLHSCSTQYPARLRRARANSQETQEPPECKAPWVPGVARNVYERPRQVRGQNSSDLDCHLRSDPGPHPDYHHPRLLEGECQGERGQGKCAAVTPDGHV